MHPLIMDILKDSNFNYGIFNKTIFSIQQNNSLKLWYYYFCISPLPGSFSKTFSLADLLELWPKSYNNNTIAKRKHALYDLLETSCAKQQSNFRFRGNFRKTDQIIIGIKIKNKTNFEISNLFISLNIKNLNFSFSNIKNSVK